MSNINDTTGSRRVLVITYYWPPSGGPGVQRVLRFVKYLPQVGWQPMVLTVKHGDYPAIDESLLRHIPAECRVFKTAAWEPHRLYRSFTGRSPEERLPTFILSLKGDESRKDRLARWVRCNLFIPDARIGWIPSALKVGRRVIRHEKIDLIFSSSPPHTVQLIAKKLARWAGLPWVADLRDPWSEAYWEDDIRKTALARRINQALEVAVLRRANAVTTVSEGLGEMFAAKAANRYQVLQNGFEPLETEPSPSKQFILLFIGHLSKHQNPRPIFEAANRLPQEIKKDLQLIFVGRIFEGFADIWQEYEQKLVLECRGYLPHDELMRFAQQASLLLRPVAQASYAMHNVGAKTADYLALRKPILTLGEKNSVSERILQETGSGSLFEYHDIAGISDYIREIYQQWKRDGFVQLNNQDKLEKYTTRYNVQNLAMLFEEILGSV